VPVTPASYRDGYTSSHKKSRTTGRFGFGLSVAASRLLSQSLSTRLEYGYAHYQSVKNTLNGFINTAAPTFCSGVSSKISPRYHTFMVSLIKKI
jgi:hypothetical protein